MNPDQNKTLRTQGIALLVMLVIQYVLGMYVNQFTQFPQDASAGQLWEFSWQQPVLAAHIILGILLLIGAIVLWVRATRFHSAAWKSPAMWGFIGILIAGASGASFIPSQAAPESYLMSLSFLPAFLAYGWGLFRADRDSLRK